MSTQATDTELKELLEKFSRNSIVLNIGVGREIRTW